MKIMKGFTKAKRVRPAASDGRERCCPGIIHFSFCNYMIFQQSCLLYLFYMLPFDDCQLFYN